MVVVAVVILIVNIEKFLHPHGAQIELSPTNRSGRDWAQIRLCVCVAVALVVGVNWVSVCWHVCALCCLGLSSAASVRACVGVRVCVSCCLCETSKYLN